MLRRKISQVRAIKSQKEVKSVEIFMRVTRKTSPRDGFCKNNLEEVQELAMRFLGSEN